MKGIYMQKEIEFKILKSFQTNKSGIFIINYWTVLNKIRRESTYSNEIDSQFMAKVFDKLVADGKIVKGKCSSGIGFKSFDFNDKKILYNNSGEEMEVECSYKKVNSILKKFQNCNWITNVRVIDNII